MGINIRNKIGIFYRFFWLWMSVAPPTIAQGVSPAQRELKSPLKRKTTLREHKVWMLFGASVGTGKPSPNHECNHRQAESYLFPALLERILIFLLLLLVYFFLRRLFCGRPVLLRACGAPARARRGCCCLPFPACAVLRSSAP